MTDEPRKRTATEAMRLKPATRPSAPSERDADPSGVAGARALDELLELHGPSQYGEPRHCLECLMPHPCRTRQLADIIAGTRTPPEEKSQ